MVYTCLYHPLLAEEGMLLTWNLVTFAIVRHMVFLCCCVHWLWRANYSLPTPTIPVKETTLEPLSEVKETLGVRCMQATGCTTLRCLEEMDAFQLAKKCMFYLEAAVPWPGLCLRVICGIMWIYVTIIYTIYICIYIRHSICTISGIRPAWRHTYSKTLSRRFRAKYGFSCPVPKNCTWLSFLIKFHVHSKDIALAQFAHHYRAEMPFIALNRRNRSVANSLPRLWGSPIIPFYALSTFDSYT
jgi:hypothetical protein